jgi:hypothetical protein
MLATPTDVTNVFTSPFLPQTHRLLQKIYPISLSSSNPISSHGQFRHPTPQNPIHTSQVPHFLPLFNHFKPSLPIFALSSQQYLTSQLYYHPSSPGISYCPSSISLTLSQITQDSTPSLSWFGHDMCSLYYKNYSTIDGHFWLSQWVYHIPSFFCFCEAADKLVVHILFYVPVQQSCRDCNFNLYHPLLIEWPLSRFSSIFMFHLFQMYVVFGFELILLICSTLYIRDFVWLLTMFWVYWRPTMVFSIWILLMKLTLENNNETHQRSEWFGFERVHTFPPYSMTHSLSPYRTTSIGISHCDHRIEQNRHYTIEYNYGWLN